MSLATFTRKGTLTIPVDVRKALGLRPEDTVRFTLLPDGAVLMRAQARALDELNGTPEAPSDRDGSIDEMKA